MTGKTQSDAVAILRNTKLGSVVNLVVSRQVVDEDSKFTVPRPLVSNNNMTWFHFDSASLPEALSVKV